MPSLTHSHLIGHRGARAEAPENTLGGFEYLRNLGINKVELDVHLSQDLELVVIHDTDTLRTTGTQLEVALTTAADLAQLNATFENKVLWNQVEPIPTLHQVLCVWENLEHIQIEIKPLESPELRVIMAHELLKHCQKLKLNEKTTVITSSDYDFLRTSKEINPLPHGLVADHEIADIANPIEVAQSSGCDLLVLHYVLYTEDMAQACREANMPVSLWTVNDVQTANLMVERGAASIITDKPKAFQAWISQQENS